MKNFIQKLKHQRKSLWAYLFNQVLFTVLFTIFLMQPGLGYDLPAIVGIVILSFLISVILCLAFILLECKQNKCVTILCYFSFLPIVLLLGFIGFFIIAVHFDLNIEEKLPLVLLGFGLLLMIVNNIISILLFSYLLIKRLK